MKQITYSRRKYYNCRKEITIVKIWLPVVKFVRSLLISIVRIWLITIAGNKVIKYVNKVWRLLSNTNI